MKNHVDPKYFAWLNQITVSRQIDEILVVDIATTCWEGEVPRGERKEIIEIAVCPLDVQTGRTAPTRSILVQPRFSTVSEYCEARTGLKASDIMGGLTLSDACILLEDEFLVRERVWASYGNTQRRRLKDDCGRKGARYPFGASHINIKTLVALIRALPREIPLAESLQLFNQGRSNDRGIVARQAGTAGLLLGRVLLESRVKYVVGVN